MTDDIRPLPASGTILRHRLPRFSSFYVKNFRWFYVSQLFLFFGSWMHQTAQAWLVYSLTGSPLYLGLLGAIMSLPMLLLTLAGGLMADRFKKRDIIIASQLLSIIPVCILAFLTKSGNIQIWQISVLAFLCGCFEAIDAPSRQTFMYQIVGKKHILNAIAVSSTAFNIARIIAPLVSGFIIKEYGVAPCFYIRAICFLPSVFVLQKIIISVELNDFESNGIKADFIDCIKFIKQDKVILGLILTVTAISLFCLPFAQFLPIFADRVFHMGSKALGYLMTSIGIGALIASLIIASAREIFNKRVYMTISGLLFPLTIIVFTLTTNIIAAVCLLVCTGAFTLCMMALTNSFIQIRVADAIRGRVMSVYIMMVLGIMPIGYLLMGYMSDILGTKNAIMINCSLCMVSFIGLRVLWRKG